MKIVSLNIEGRKHLERVREFLAKEKADVVSLMEVYGGDVASLAGTTYPYMQYLPNNVVERVGGKVTETLGVAILSQAPIGEREKYYCDGKTAETIADLGLGTHSPVLLVGKIEEIEVGVVHFTWTPGASITAQQTEHLTTLLKVLKGREIVLCGDFNIPRGNANYQRLASVYQDNIPMDVNTTLDPYLHRVNQTSPGKLAYVVDYLWSTPKYQVSNVRVVAGVSDHCGVMGDVNCI